MAIDAVEAHTLAVRTAVERIPAVAGVRTPEQQRIASIREKIENFKPRERRGEAYLLWRRQQGEFEQEKKSGDDVIKKALDRHIRSTNESPDDTTGLRARSTSERAIFDQAVGNALRVRSFLRGSDVDGSNPWYDSLSDVQKNFFRVQVGNAIIQQELADEIFPGVPLGNSDYEAQVRANLLADRIDGLLKDPAVVDRIRTGFVSQLEELGRTPETNAAARQKDYTTAKDERLAVEKVRDDAQGKLDSDFRDANATLGITEGDKTKLRREAQEEMDRRQVDYDSTKDDIEDLTELIRARRETLKAIPGGDSTLTAEIRDYEDKIQKMRRDVIRPYDKAKETRDNLDTEKKRYEDTVKSAKTTLGGDGEGSNAKEVAAKAAFDEAEKDEKEAIGAFGTVIFKAVKDEIDDRKRKSIEYMQAEDTTQKEQGGAVFEAGLKRRWRKKEGTIDKRRADEAWRLLMSGVGDHTGVEKLVEAVLRTGRYRVGDEDVPLEDDKVAALIADSDFVHEKGEEAVVALIKARKPKEAGRSGLSAADVDNLKKLFGDKADEMIAEATKSEPSTAADGGHGKDQDSGIARFIHPIKLGKWMLETRQKIKAKKHT